jgi:hypothetical protein
MIHNLCRKVEKGCAQPARGTSIEAGEGLIRQSSIGTILLRCQDVASRFCPVGETRVYQGVVSSRTPATRPLNLNTIFAETNLIQNDLDENVESPSKACME